MVLKDAASEFLSHRRIVVAGVSRDPKPHSANAIYRRLRDAGYQVFACNPNADVVEGDPCYHSIAAVPGPIDGVVIATHPRVSRSVVQECAQAGIRRVWIHRGPDNGSMSDDAVALCKETGIAVIDGACPMMFLPPVDGGHKVLRFVLGLFGKLPNGSNYAPQMKAEHVAKV